MTSENISSSATSAFTGILDKPKKLAGYPQNTVTQDMVDQLRQWGINEI